MSRSEANTATGQQERYARQRRFARESALQYLYQADQQDEWTGSEVSIQCFRLQIAALDERPDDVCFEEAWDYTLQLIHGVCQHHLELDGMLESCAQNWTLVRMNVIDRNILRIAAFEILHSPKVPRVAAINEAVELAKAYGDRDSSRFVNGILDKLMHQSEGSD